MFALLRDLRFAARMLAKSPGYTFVAAFTLALAIGANTAIFSAVNRVLIQPLPYAEPERLRLIMDSLPDVGTVPVAYFNYLDYQASNTTFAAVAAASPTTITLTGEGEPERVKAGLVSHNLLPTLGVEPALGRNFTAAEDAPRSAKAAILSHGLWTRRYAADPEIVGRAVTIDSRDWMVVGVMPPTFRFPFEPDVLVPLGAQADQPEYLNRAARFGIFVVARLKDGATDAAAEADMNALADDLARRHPVEYRDVRPNIRDMHLDFSEPQRGGLLLLMSAVICVLLIATANVANLMLERAMTREREMRVRAALGAGRWQLIRQLLVESSLLALLGAAFGLLLALWGVDLLTATMPTSLGLELFGPIEIDATVLSFTLAVALGTGLLFGVVPALYASKQDLAQAIKEVDRHATAGGRHLRARGLLVVGEVALALMLLAAAGLTLRALARMQASDVGFDVNHLLRGVIALPPDHYTSAPQIHAFYSELQRRVAALPGVESVAVSMGAPFSGSHHDNFLPLGDTRPITAGSVATTYMVDVGYLEAMKIPLRSGRTFGPQDGPQTPIGLIIDAQMADSLFPGEDPVGKRIQDRLSEQPSVEIIGVVDHVKQYSLDSWEFTPYQMYYAYTQVPENSRSMLLRQMLLLVRTHGEPTDIVPQLRAVVGSLDPTLPLYDVETLDRLSARTIASQRAVTRLLAVFAGLALVLAAVGVYAVMSSTVAQRTHELGVRMALGARPQAVVALVVRQGMTLVALGLVFGAIGSLALSHLLESLLSNQIHGVDPLILAGVTLTLVLVGLAATYVPARRATHIDPMVALRQD